MESMTPLRSFVDETVNKMGFNYSYGLNNSTSQILWILDAKNEEGRNSNIELQAIFV
jgi:hypothetical protein